MINIKQVDTSYFAEYDRIPMRLRVEREYRLVKREGGLGGFALVETDVEPYIKDFCVGEDKSVVSWKRWNLSNWAFFMAYDCEKPVGAAAVATRTQGVNMLCGRDDLAVLWDIRVAEEYKRRGVGGKLFRAAAEWSKARGMVQLKIECQTNNVPAIKFYHKQGARLGGVDEYAYYGNPYAKGETQLIWYLELRGGLPL